MSKNKASNGDMFIDTFLKEADWILLYDLWNYRTLQDNPEIFKARLVLLNKVYPKIPKYD